MRSMLLWQATHLSDKYSFNNWAMPKPERRRFITGKNKRITFRLSESDYESLIKRCDVAHLSVSAFVLRCVSDKEIIVISEIKEFRTELRRIGNNLNQIAMLCNSGIIKCAELESVQQGLSNIWQTLNLLRKSQKSK